MRWELIAAASLVIFGSAAADPAPRPKRVARDALPPGVTLVARGVWGGGVSPDGTRFAHFTGMRSRQVEVRTIDGATAPVKIATGEKTCSSSACLDDRCGRIAWAPDGSRLAIRTDDGLFEVDVADRSKRRVDTKAARATCEFRFAGDGVLEWLAPGKHGDALMRDGETESVIELPATANEHEIGDRIVITGTWAANAGYRGAWTDLWIVDRVKRKVRKVYHRDGGDPDDQTEPMWDPRLSPDEARVCWQGFGVHCISTRTGKDTLISAKAGQLAGRWGHEKTLPFSPSGNLLAFRVAGTGGDTLMIHDFTTGKTRDVVAPLRHQDHAFQGETMLLLYEQEDARDKTIPPIVRVELADGSETAIVSSPETQYNAPVFAADRTDVLFIGRERGGGRDLVRIDVAEAIAGAQ
jgi:hypothetical protein